MRPKLIRLLMIVTLSAPFLGANALARGVTINGELMNQPQLQLIDRLACARVPDGAYWVNTRTGQWGFQGGGPQGFVGDRCRVNRPELYHPRLLQQLSKGLR